MKTVRIDFSKSGWRQFAKLNRNLGARFIKGIILRRELAAYIAAHEQSGVHLDTLCQALHYGDGIDLIVMKIQGVWYITDVWLVDEPKEYAPIFTWMRIQRGLSTMLAHVLVGWRRCVAPKAVPV